MADKYERYNLSSIEVDYLSIECASIQLNGYQHSILLIVTVITIYIDY
ncbi:hypothetical protein [Methanosarcina sp. UBA5]|nr:hypothetical protein [Methanosarcina sp. UBA5]